MLGFIMPIRDSSGLLGGPASFSSLIEELAEAPKPLARYSAADFSGVRERFEELSGFAWSMLAALKAQVEAFQASLKPDEETAAILAHFGGMVEIVVEQITYRDPHLIVIKGIARADKRPVELLQHVSQVNLLLKPVTAESGKGRRIGFDAPQLPTK